MTTTADNAARTILRRQHGAISADQARGAGPSQEQCEWRVERGDWVRASRGVFTLVGTPETWSRQAWVAYLATSEAGGALWLGPAGAVHGVMRPPPVPRVSVPPGRSTRCRVAVVHPRAVPRTHIQYVDGLRVTTPSRLLVDMASCLARPDLEGLVDVVLCQALASVDSVVASLTRATGSPRGHALLRDVLSAWAPGIEPGSVAEMRLLRQLAELGVADLVTQYAVYDADGLFVARLDIARPTRRKSLEYDSVLHHNPRQWTRDEPRYQRLRAAGWDVEGVTKADLMPGSPRLAQIVDRWNRDAAA